MKILFLTAHSIFEYDELRLFHSLGHEVLSIGAYLDPANPQDNKRPALPEIPPAPQELRDLVADQMAAKSDLPDEVLDWADVVIVNFFTIGAPEDRPGWLLGNWAKFKAHGNRVIWRTAGQSNHVIEVLTQPVRDDGLEIIRYSPKERNIPNFCGEDALIRFSKDPADWYGWTGEEAVVGNVTQNLAQRGDACGYPFWRAATDGLPTSPAGPGSQEIGGVGELTYDEMRAYLRGIRCYLYLGTQPASYTLGLIEAMMTGVPVVSIGPAAFGGGTYLADLFEAHEIVNGLGDDFSRLLKYPLFTDDPLVARSTLDHLLHEPEVAEVFGHHMRWAAEAAFGVDTIREQWRAYL